MCPVEVPRANAYKFPGLNDNLQKQTVMLIVPTLIVPRLSMNLNTMSYGMHDIHLLITNVMCACMRYVYTPGDVSVISNEIRVWTHMG